MDVYTRIKALEPHIGELVIDESRTVVRFLGCTCDDEDCYYRLFDLNKGVSLHSMVGSIVLLKGKIDKKDYERLDTQFTRQFDYFYGVGRNETLAKGKGDKT